MAIGGEIPHAKKFKSLGESTWNMASYYFQILSDMMQGIAEKGFYAEATLKSREIIGYYSVIRQYFLLLSPILKYTEIEEFERGFTQIKSNINFLSKNVINKTTVVSNLQEVQKDLYDITQQRRILLPMLSEKGGMINIEKKMGLR